MLIMRTMIVAQVVGYLLLCLFVISYGYRIDIKRNGFVQLGDVKISEKEIHKQLEDHEKILLFGKKNSEPVNIKLVHVSYVDRKRTKRSTNNFVTIKLEDNEDQVDLILKQTPKLIDDSFILIRRYENTSQFIENSHQLAVNYERCFYRNENSALDLCNETIRGIFHHNSSGFLIYPLPPRFGKNSHIIVESKNSYKNRYYDGSQDDNNFSHKVDDIMVNDIDGFEPVAEFDESVKVGDSSGGGGAKWKFSARGKHVANVDVCPVNDGAANSENRSNRTKRHIATQWKVPHVLHIETAIFVDEDLFKHMAKNFPENTENHLIRFVLAMINGVQLLYHHPSLGHEINFVLKRLEILHKDPADLRRSSNIDMFLNNFCLWQQKLNPASDTDVVHYDHAVILTGLDLYVVGTNGKVSSQVVGLAPVAGMCIPTSSCTINEGKHFESVFVVAHEIGHNLGMRHDTSEYNCDPSLYIMSPTLGSGKITWSKCSRSFLNAFLETSQAKCMFDRGQFGHNLDHSAEGILPGERFDADQQCMLKYGKDSIRSRNQPLADICRDLHCQRERYTWTSHPALEGTECGEMMWCRSGVCGLRATLMEAFSIPKQISASKQYDKVNFIDDKKFASLRHEYNFNKLPTWSDWGQPSDCDSGCLYGPSGRLREGSTGLKIYTRNCLDYKRRCIGRDRKYEACIAKQCYTIAKTTVNDFATQVCERAKKFDNELTGEGLQSIGESAEEACKVYCRTHKNETKSRSWTFPDGTTCHTTKYDFDDTSYCISGRCEKFICENATRNYFKMDERFCPQSLVQVESQQWNNVQQENGRDYKRFRSQNKVENNDINSRSFQTARDNVRKYDRWILDRAEQTAKLENAWIVKSGCHFSCMEQAKGIQIVATAADSTTNNIQLCSPEIMPCDKLQTTIEFSENICSRYKLKVRGLSGYGMQIAPSVQDPDRSCRVACQDEILPHRFYLVNGDQGLYPFGTRCSTSDDRYCVNGKCLEFGPDNIPLSRSYISLPLFRSKRGVQVRTRRKRSFLFYRPINITEDISQQFLDSLIRKLNFQLLDELPPPEPLFPISDDHIEFGNPIHVSNDELIEM